MRREGVPQSNLSAAQGNPFERMVSENLIARLSPREQVSPIHPGILDTMTSSIVDPITIIGEATMLHAIFGIASLGFAILGFLTIAMTNYN
jgi:hypothetical protein